jgi:hypothetical protein
MLSTWWWVLMPWPIMAGPGIRRSDIWIKPSPENAGKMVSVLKDFGFGSLGLTEDDFYVTQLGYPPLRIDILNSISGVNFDDAYKGRILGKNDDLYVSFINISALLQTKKHQEGQRI